MSVETPEATRRIERAAEILNRVSGEVGRAVVGQRQMVDRLLVGLLTGGHVLLEGVPGLAKTLAVKSLSDAVALKFRREQEGTYPLPEAQSDRFMLKVKIGYPERHEEKEILRRVGLSEPPKLTPQANREDLLEARSALAYVYVDDKLQEYVLDLVTATRRPKEAGLAIENLVSYGASPRATLFLVRGAQALALLDGRPYVLPEDVKSIAPDVLRHRIHVSYEAEAEGVDGEEVARRILERVRVP